MRTFPLWFSLACTSSMVVSSAHSLPQDTLPRTTAETSGWVSTSTHSDVSSFLERLEGLYGGAHMAVETIGASKEGRELLLVRLGSPLPMSADAEACGDRLRVLITGNIHGGEVEGKEALQQIMREVVTGQHGPLLEKVALFFVPVYNADGNDAIARTNRVSQNGPDGGVGERANGQGLDLNRDFIKAESPECQALLGLMNRLDPHLYVDLHTTNGSDHAYHLTYAPSLSTNVDPDLDRMARDKFLPGVRAAMARRAGWRIFDYGNFSGREQVQWTTYDHRPRFGTNYVGLRNRFSILSEAYSYLPFRERVDVTHDFVLEILTYAAEHAGELRAACEAADARALGGDLSFGVDTGLAAGRALEVMRGNLSSVELPGLGTRRVVGDEWSTETMQVRVSFESKRQVSLPAAWALPEPQPEVLKRLAWHGLQVVTLKEDVSLTFEAFEIQEVRRAKRLFQGHHETSVRGGWQTREGVLPAGSVVVSAHQSRVRVAAQLLEPESEDGLTTWNFLDDGLGESTEGEPHFFPVLRIRSVTETSPLFALLNPKQP
ncbi:MAG TPA: M14 family metallopeptidase [Planctomycetota bacterium]|nr:M14 family metallopeptidase [Planctomycetota bacterium]